MAIENNSQNLESLWGIKELAHFLGIKETTVYKKVALGQLPYYKLGVGKSSFLRFDPNEIRNFMSTRHVEAFSVKEASDGWN